MAYPSKRGHDGTVIEFAKGHGTGNDFVIVEDLDGTQPLGRAQVASLCHRRMGIGGDGLLRVVRAGRHPDATTQADEAEWFMDYYNADGSIAEMCGNGVRVFAHYLIERGLASGEKLPIATRAGLKVVSVDDDAFSVDMGEPSFGVTTAAQLDGVSYAGTKVLIPNPHLVCWVDELDTINLMTAPQVDNAMFPDGANVEFISVGPTGAIRMRVHERGVGETLSCGTGACAAAAVALGGDGSCRVQLPGGQLSIVVKQGNITMTGPATLVARGSTTLV